MDDKVILLVEDNADDEALTLRALKKNNIKNDVVVARDGVEALDYLLGSGPTAGRPSHDVPQLVLLDLKLPRVEWARSAEARARRSPHPHAHRGDSQGICRSDRDLMHVR